MLSKIKFLKENHLYRKLVNVDFVGDVVVKKDGRRLICFSSNDYFGLANDAKVKRAGIKAVKRFGVGARASRYVCGNNSLYQELEKKIAKINGCDDAIVFSSGYQTAIGVIPALVEKGDLILADKLIHSCLIDGAKLSGAKLLRFKHNDFEHARKILSENSQKYAKILIITEEIFSMDGDKGEIALLQKLSQAFGAKLLIDGAHSLYESVSYAKNQIKMGTFSKALGSFGGYVAGDFELIDYLRNFAKSVIYTTALPPCVLAASIQSLQIIEKKKLGVKTLENARYFCDLMKLPKPESAIIMIEIGDNEKAVLGAKKVEEKGFLISAIRPPTVESARLRITFCAKHTKKQIAKLAKSLQDIF